MKHFLLICVCTISVSLSGFTDSVPKWRTVTISNMSGIDAIGQTINTTSLSVHYELKNNIAITSWSGVQVSKVNGWYSSQALITKSKGGLSYGVGFQCVGVLVPQSIPSNFGVVNVSYRFKLR